MKINMTFREGSVFGEGTDRGGGFTFEGTYSERYRVELTKRYDPLSVLTNFSCPEIRYRGKWNGQFISGTWWQVGYPSNSGAIEMWPLDSEESLEAFMQEVAASEHELSSEVNSRKNKLLRSF